MKLAIKTKSFNQEKLNEVINKFSNYVDAHFGQVENFCIMYPEALDIFGPYIGLRPVENSDIINMMEEDKELNRITKKRNGLPGRRFLRLHIGHITMSIVQGHYLYTRNDHEYEIALLDTHGMIKCEEFHAIDLPEYVNKGDYSSCAGDEGCENCSSQIIPYLNFSELTDYICAISKYIASYNNDTILDNHADVSF